MVTKLDAHWKEPPADLGLEELSSEVIYSPAAFKGAAQAFWLPVTARVEVKTQHQHWRNTHEFSGYRLFSVEADSTVGAAASEPESPKGKNKR